jgi:putative transposase
MLVLEFKAYGKLSQFTAVDQAIRTAKFIRNSCIRLWMDVKGTNKFDLNKYCAVLAATFPFADQLNSMARQASAERAWSSISRFLDNRHKGANDQKGFPKFQKDCRSVEYKTSGWKLATDKKSISFTDKNGIGKIGRASCRERV